MKRLKFFQQRDGVYLLKIRENNVANFITYIHIAWDSCFITWL